MPLQFETPTSGTQDWLLDVENQIADLIDRKIESIAREATHLYFDSLTASGDYGVFDIIPLQWQAFVNGELVDVFLGVHQNGSVTTFFGVPGSIPPEAVFQWVGVVNAEAVAYARTMPNRMKDVGDHLWNDLRTKISTAIETGDVADRLERTIRETTQFSRYRAEMIARTETTRAFNAGTLAGAQALGVYGPREKVWSSGFDDDVRTTHREADNQYRPLNQPFNVGGAQLQHPGGDGPAKEVINCRCTLLLLYPGDKRPDGTIVPDTPLVGDVPDFFAESVALV
jgi:hypothetical protein